MGKKWIDKWCHCAWVEHMQTTGNPSFSTVSAVWVDDSTKIIYIADQLSGTIQRWYGSHGDIIAGRSYIHIDY